MIDTFEKLARRFRLMIARSVVNLISDAGEIQLVQVNSLAGETRDEVEHLQTYGHTSHAPSGAQAVVLFPDGDRTRGIALVVGHKSFRPVLAKGESALYDDQGQTITIHRDHIEIKTTKPVVIDSPETTITGDLQVAGSIATEGTINAVGEISSDDDVKAATVSLKTHVHPGVMSGGAVTGVPQ